MEHKDKQLLTQDLLCGGLNQLGRGRSCFVINKQVSLSGQYDAGEYQYDELKCGKMILDEGDLLCAYFLKADAKGAKLYIKRKSVLYYLANKICKTFASKIKGIHFTKSNCDFIAENDKKLGSLMSLVRERDGQSLIIILLFISIVKNDCKTKAILACKKNSKYKGEHSSRNINQICCSSDYGVGYDDFFDFFSNTPCEELEMLNEDYQTDKKYENLPYFGIGE